jgi:hypothetical protein
MSESHDRSGNTLIHSHWFSLHGFPEQVVSDRGTHFNNKFTSALLASLGIKQSLSTAYHPQTDGQTERTNRVVEDMLRHYVSPTQNDWHKYLPFVEFAINNSKHEATGVTPFSLVYGEHPCTPGAYGLRIPPAQVPAATDTVSQWQSAVSKAKSCLTAARDRMSTYHNTNRTHSIYSVGQQVLLSTQNINLTLPGTNKFHPRCVGLLTITELIDPVAVRQALCGVQGTHMVSWC